MKRIIAVILVAVLIVCQIPQNVFADTPVVTVDNTIGDLLVGYSGNDILTQSNYLNNYDEVSGYLKYCARSGIYAYNGNSDFGGNFETVIKGFIDDNDQSFMSIPFPEVNGYKFMYFNYWRDDWSPHLGCTVVVTEGNLYNVEGVLISDQPMYIYTNWTVFTNGGNNIGTTDLNDGTPNVTVDTKASSYLPDYYVYDAYNTDIHYTNPSMWIYSDIPFYMTAYKNSQYTDGDFLVDNYNYDDIAQVFNAIGTDTTGFVIDRRSEHMINESSGYGSSDQIISDGFDPELFDGSLGFNWFNSSGSTNYVQSLDQYKPFIQLKYKINNYTDIHKNDVSLVWDSEINMKLTYRDSSNVTFITSCRYQASGDWDLVGHENQFTLLAAQESNLYSLKSVRSTSGSNPYGNEFRDTNNINQNISFGISSYRHNSAVVTNSESDAYDLIKDFFSGNKGNRTLDSYGIIYFNVYLKDNVTGETSIIYKSAFDLFNNKFDDNHTDLVNNDDSAYNDFIDSFNYQDDNGDLSLVDYAKPYGYGISSSQVGDITIYQNPYPYLLVDIPEGEWMSKTPRLTTILKDFKDALSEVKNDSILNVMSETYNYLPVPVWQYFTYGVGILIAIGIWRAITRR